MTGTYNNLRLTILLRESDRKRHGGYRYLVANSFSHRAFRTKAGIVKFLADSGLHLGRRGHSKNTIPLLGSYKEVCMMDENKFSDMRYSGKYRLSDIVSNGDYTVALVGVGAIYYLNPNCKREVLTYRWD